MNIAGKTEEKVFKQDTGIDDNMTAPVGGKEGKFGFMLGAFNDGLRVVLKRKDLLHPSDQSLIKIQRAMFNKYELTFEHSRDFKFRNKLYNLAFDYQQTFRFAKFIAYEKVFMLKLKDLWDFPDWELNLSASHRRNVFDSASCLDYFKYHSLTNRKVAVALNYNKLDYNYLLNGNMELAMTPGNGAKFFKVECDRAKSWLHESLKIKFVNYTKFGLLFPLSNQHVPLNDKFFIFHNMGFNNLGHTELPVQQLSEIKKDHELVLDDLGSNKYFSHQFRVEFSDLPLLKALDLKAMWYLDMIYYPQEFQNRKEESSLLKSSVTNLLDYTRVSHGVGISYAFSPIMSI